MAGRERREDDERTQMPREDKPRRDSTGSPRERERDESEREDRGQEPGETR